MEKDLYTMCVELFEQANNNFLESETENILLWTHEISLCSKLGQYLDRLLTENWYHVDTEYNRNYWWKMKTIINDDLKVIPIKCDLIIHSRWWSIESDNLITLEMKKSTASNKAKDSDRERLICLTKDPTDKVWSDDWSLFPEHVCWYLLWIYYEIDISNRTILLEFYKKWKMRKTETVKF